MIANELQKLRQNHSLRALRALMQKLIANKIQPSDAIRHNTHDVLAQIASSQTLDQQRKKIAFQALGQILITVYDIDEDFRTVATNNNVLNVLLSAGFDPQGESSSTRGAVEITKILEK